MAHTFFAVSTGPAKSEYLTLGALRVLEQCTAIFYPVTGRREKAHLAFDCVCEAVDVSTKTCVGVEFSMTRDEAVTAAEYDGVLRRLEEELARGDVAFVAIGDVSVYSTAARLAHLVARRGHAIRFVAGVNSFCAAACACALDLAGLDSEIRIIPGDAYAERGRIDAVLREPGTKIFMKSSHHLGDIAAAALASVPAEKIFLVKGVGHENQEIFSGAELAAAGAAVYEHTYIAVLIVLG